MSSSLWSANFGGPLSTSGSRPAASSGCLGRLTRVRTFWRTAGCAAELNEAALTCDCGIRVLDAELATDGGAAISTSAGGAAGLSTGFLLRTTTLSFCS